MNWLEISTYPHKGEVTHFVRGKTVTTTKARKLANTLLECFGDVEAAHCAYRRAMQNFCSLRDFENLLDGGKQLFFLER